MHQPTLFIKHSENQGSLYCRTAGSIVNC